MKNKLAFFRLSFFVVLSFLFVVAACAQAAPEPQLPPLRIWEINHKNAPADARADLRKTECGQTYDRLRETTDLKFRTAPCELASVGHPNVAGSKLIFEAIKTRLAPFFRV